jgi:hypothetical protein
VGTTVIVVSDRNAVLASVRPPHLDSPLQLNYTAYQITSKSAQITLFYSFPSMKGSATLALSTDFGPITSNQNGVTYVACGSPGVPCNGLSIKPLQPKLNYQAFLNASVTFTISDTNPSLSGIYLFYPPDGRCYNVVLIIGNQVPSDIPTIYCSGVSLNAIMPNISVVGIQNMTGLNISAS